MLVTSKMEFEGFPAKSTVSWIMNEEDGVTNLTYTYDWVEISGTSKFFALMMESMLGPMRAHV